MLRTARDMNAQIAQQFSADESHIHALETGLQQQMADQAAMVAQIKADEPDLERSVRMQVAMAKQYPDLA